MGAGPISGQELERFRVRGTHDREMSTVESRDLPDLQSFGEGDHGRVDGSEWKIAVSPAKLCDPNPVRRFNHHRFIRTLDELGDEAELDARPAFSLEQVRHFGDHQHRDEQRAAMALEEPAAVVVSWVARITGGDERAAVDDEPYSSPLWRFSSKISPKISSTRVDRSPDLLRKVPALRRMR